MCIYDYVSSVRNMDGYILSGQCGTCVCVCVCIGGVIVGEGGQRRLIEVPSKKWEREQKVGINTIRHMKTYVNLHKIFLKIFLKESYKVLHASYPYLKHLWNLKLTPTDVFCLERLELNKGSIVFF